jgi:hypothetical protein
MGYVLTINRRVRLRITSGTNYRPVKEKNSTSFSDVLFLFLRIGLIRSS